MVVSFLLTLPVIGFFSYVGFAFYMIDDVASFTFNLDPPNTTYFIPLDQIEGNETNLEKMAEVFD